MVWQNKRKINNSRFAGLFFAGFSLFFALSAWAFASPIGSSPDDDFHLVSIWCSSSATSNLCETGDQANQRIVPEILIKAPCFAYKPEISASCLENVGFSTEEKVTTDRGNFVGGYPPIFYWTMGHFAGTDFQLSILLMRFFNIAIFLALSFLTFLFLPYSRKGILLWSYLATSLPLGIFLISSNNPSSWAFIGVGISWIAFLGFVESKERVNRLALGVVTLLATIIAAGARADAAAYVVIGVIVVTILKVKTPELKKIRTLDLVVVIGILLISFYSFFSANQSISAINGFGNPVSQVGGFGGEVEVLNSVKPTGFGLFAYNLLNMPDLWTGMLGSWGLGWLDTTLPSFVHVGSLAVFVSLMFTGFANLNKRKLFSLATVGIALLTLPLYVLTKGGSYVGTEVQPRYLLPLLVIFIGIGLLQGKKHKISLTRGQLILIAMTLISIYFISLHFNIRRYVTGIEDMGFNLDENIQWWWDGMISPMGVLAIGSISFAIFCFIAIRNINIFGSVIETASERTEK